MTSSEWTRAIFVRDPLERLLSAYLEKGIRMADPSEPVTGYCVKKVLLLDGYFGMYCRKFPLVPKENNVTEANFPFESFVTSFMAQCDDTHWKPQHSRKKRRELETLKFCWSFWKKKG
mmetsp:Transcript_14537/g.33664  ORF Transcript_14537/g.33664 Transcript_14537/m.33664 type:complete len:118 (-) Transcript_14537:2919-3272(-)